MDRSPRKLTANDLGGPHGLLGRFGIKSHSQWTAGGRKERRGDGLFMSWSSGPVLLALGGDFDMAAA